mmetsp:Transcript_153229/g.270362  ORF Transcript_153229/g.270362 Transcript_153229/m.270362 type:complete len:214 (+) Transcript_153229:273-914(+)
MPACGSEHGSPRAGKLHWLRKICCAMVDRSWTGSPSRSLAGPSCGAAAPAQLCAPAALRCASQSSAYPPKTAGPRQQQASMPHPAWQAAGPTSRQHAALEMPRQPVACSRSAGVAPEPLVLGFAPGFAAAPLPALSAPLPSHSANPPPAFGARSAPSGHDPASWPAPFSLPAPQKAPAAGRAQQMHFEHQTRPVYHATSPRAAFLCVVAPRKL